MKRWPSVSVVLHLLGSRLQHLKVFRSIRPLNRYSIRRDALAGVSLASMNIPQVLGYARIAGMPAVTGLFTVFLPLIAFALFGASRHLVVAADSATATILASRLSSMAPIASADYVALASTVALLTSGMLLLARLFKLGFLADFLSRTVLVGFLAGVGIQVGVAMLGDMTGVILNSHHTVVQLERLLAHWSMIQWPSLELALLVVVSILVGEHWFPKLPIPFIAVVVGIGASRFYDFAAHGIAVLGPIAAGLPAFYWPMVGWQEVLSLIPVAASCCVMILAQSAATGRVFAQRYHETVDENADILGLAAANAAAAISGSFVVNGSPTQTAMAEMAGARSQLAQLVFAAMVVLVLLFFSQWLQYLPRCILAGIVFTIAIGLIKAKTLLNIRHESPGEFNLAMITAVAVILIGVENGILIAVALSLLRHVRHSYQPHTMMLTVSDEDGTWQPVPAQPGRDTTPGLIVYRFGADLFYANEHFFIEDVRRLIDLAPHPVHWLVIDAGAITDLDYSAARSVGGLCEDLVQSGVVVLFARVNRYLRSDMDRHGISNIVGSDRIFNTLHQALDELRQPAGH